MYYEEKIINGVLCWRKNPNDEFTSYSIEELSQRYWQLKESAEEDATYREMAESGLFGMEMLRDI